MKRRWILAGLFVSMLAAVGCSKKDKATTATTTEAIEVTTEATTENTTEATTESAQIDYEAVYAPVLQHTFDVIVSEDDIDDIEEEDMGIYEIKMYDGIEAGLNNVGYAYRDLNDDDVPELIIGSKFGTILAIYGIENDKPVFLVAGRSRSTKNLMKDGKTIHTYGSSGAAYSIFGTMQVSKDGKSIEWQDCYFTYPDDNNSVHYYHNTTGIWEPEEAEELNINNDDFFALDEAVYEDFEESLGLTYFIDVFDSSYIPTGDSNGGVGNEIPRPTGTSLDVMLADECRNLLTNYETLDITYGGEFSTEVAFRPVDGSISEIYFYEIEYTASNEDNQWFKEKKILTYYEFLNSDQQLIVKMTFPGDMPTIGFSYVNGSGEEQHFAISLSGFDGSVVISPYFPDNE